MQITNVPEQHVKRRTMQAPKHASTAPAMLKRGHTVSGTGAGEALLTVTLRLSLRCTIERLSCEQQLALPPV
jgi:hypothetical protein